MQLTPSDNFTTELVEQTYITESQFYDLCFEENKDYIEVCTKIHTSHAYKLVQK